MKKWYNYETIIYYFQILVKNSKDPDPDSGSSGSGSGLRFWLDPDLDPNNWIWIRNTDYTVSLKTVADFKDETGSVQKPELVRTTSNLNPEVEEFIPAFQRVRKKDFFYIKKFLWYKLMFSCRSLLWIAGLLGKANNIIIHIHLFSKNSHFPAQNYPDHYYKH